MQPLGPRLAPIGRPFPHPTLMHFSRFAFGSLLAIAPLLAQAQTTETVAAPRFYVGLAAYSSYYQRAGHQNFGGIQLPVQLTAGYQWRPRLAVQVGVAYSRFSNPYSYLGYYYPTPAGTEQRYYQRNGRATTNNTSVAVLGRYTLTRQPAHRVQFDLLGGFTLEHGSYRDRGTTTDSTQAGSYDKQYSSNSLLFTFGPSVRFRLHKSLELFSDYTFNVRLAATEAYQPERVTTAGSLGLRYRFGAR
jgi:hypothetical protein